MLGREIEASYLVVYARRSWKAVGNACPVRWDRKRGGNSRGGKSHGWWSSADSAGPNESQDRAWERKKRGNLINWINWNILLDLFLSIGMDVWRVKRTHLSISRASKIAEGKEQRGCGRDAKEDCRKDRCVDEEMKFSTFHAFVFWRKF